MAINIKNLETRIQKKAASVTSNTPTAELGDIIEAANLATGGLAQYDSAGLLPTASSTQNIKLAYIKKDNSIRFNSGSAWNTMTPGASVGGAVPTPPGAIDYAGANAYQMYNTVGKFDMSTTTTASSIPALGTSLYPNFSRGRASGRSATKGYYMFNYSPNDTSIDAFPFAAEDAMTDTTGTLTQVRKNFQGEPVGDGLFCYAVGGFNPGIGIVNTVDKFPTAADDQAGTDVGDLTVARSMQAHVSSTTFGYAAGGGGPPGAQNVIDKFPFATDENATDVGDLINPSQALAGASSTTYGYAAGGHGTPAPGNRRNNIDKFAFASDGNSTDVGDLASTKDNTGGASSATHGFALGGAAGAAGNTIHRWAFASDGNATDYADMHESTIYAAVTHDTA